ncbi:MAG: type IV secretion system protein [Novosphingobium sp.]|nr:type IV secretion system protein [Novosphingobium sp.]
MSACDALVAGASAGVAPALRAVDCVAANLTGAAFSRLFGAEGALAPALTILLTLYIAFFAFSLITGRSALGISALTPRMLTLGLVLTFATSWIAYQGVLWNLATGAPDQIAGILMGVGGSATQIFADRIDIVFAAIGEVSQTAAGGQGGGEGAAGTFTPGNLMWLAALLLMLGTVGVLVTARIALAVLLAIGPVFVVFALFGGTRGLTAGWLRGVVMTAIVPLFVVVGGGITIELLVPVIGALAGPEGVSGRAAMALFLIASIHVALMVMVMKVTATMVSAWSVFGLGSGKDGEGRAGYAAQQAPVVHSFAASPGAQAQPVSAGRAALVAPASVHVTGEAGSGQGGSARPAERRTVVTHAPAAQATNHPPLARQRARGIGSRFRAPAAQPRQQVLR